MTIRMTHTSPPESKNKPFYSRKHNKWFKSFQGFKKYDEGSKRHYYYKNITKLKYDKSTDTLYDSVTGNRLKNKVSKYRYKR